MDSNSTLAAVIFDMDGVILDSEPLWRQAEVEVFRSVGVPMTVEMCNETMGTRSDDVVAHWYVRYPWKHLTVAQVEVQLIDRVAQLVEEHAKGQMFPGVREAIAVCQEAGLALGLASSSPFRLINAILHALDLTNSFTAVASAEAETHGKPHPAVYLTCARSLEIVPMQCMAIEDSLFGLIAAKAARMRCTIVPDPSYRQDPRLALADEVRETLVGWQPPRPTQVR